MTKREAPIYKVIFLNQGQVYEMYAKQIYQSDLWGFLEVEEFVFGERTQIVVDPSEEKLKRLRQNNGRPRQGKLPTENL